MGQRVGQKVDQKVGQRKARSIKEVFKLLRPKDFARSIKRRGGLSLLDLQVAPQAFNLLYSNTLSKILMK